MGGTGDRVFVHTGSRREKAGDEIHLLARGCENDVGVQLAQLAMIRLGEFHIGLIGHHPHLVGRPVDPLDIENRLRLGLQSERCGKGGGGHGRFETDGRQVHGIAGRITSDAELA